MIIQGNQVLLENMKEISDLGIIFDSKLRFDQHIQNKVNKAYNILGIINRNFRNLSIDAFVNIYKSLVRSHLEYAVTVWSPHRQMHIEELEKVQIRATRMIKQFKNKSYEERLRILYYL